MRTLVVVLTLVSALALGVAGAHGQQPQTEQGKDARELWAFRESVALGIPESELVALVADCRKQGFTRAEVQRLLGLMARAKLAGLPHGDMLLKLREGLAKGASPELIDAALADLAQVLRRAKKIVDSLLIEGYAADDYEMAIKMVGDALESGMSPQQVLSAVRGSGHAPMGTPDPAGAFRFTAPQE